MIRKLRYSAALWLRRFEAAINNLQRRAARNCFPIMRKNAIEELRRRPMDGAQWHRWYKANARRQRQLRALRRLGLQMAPHKLGDLKRYQVS